MSSEIQEFEGYKGVWRTVGGRHIFIRNGEGLASAMKRSGKFKSHKEGKNIKNTAKTTNTSNKKENVKTNIMSAKMLKYKMNEGEINENAKVIFSTSSDEKLEKVKDKLILRYDDVETGKGAFTEDMAKQVVKFTEKYKSTDDLCVVCDAGQSRSSAIASAIQLKYNKDDMNIWENPNYSPNKQVYKTMIKAFGINLSDEEIERKVKINRDALRNTINQSRK